MFSARSVSKSYPGVKALKGVDFCARPGAIHALLGANGAGKSTLLKILAGSAAPDEGWLELDGERIELGSPRAARELGIEFVVQEVDTALVPWLSVAENVLLEDFSSAGSPLVNMRSIRARARERIENLGFSIDVRQRVDELSIAQRQAVLIARAMAPRTKYLLLDEPSSALGSRECRELMRVLRELALKGLGIIYVSHRLAEVQALCDEVSVLRDGQTSFTGATPPVERMVEAMFGGATRKTPVRGASTGEAVLEVRGLSDGAKLKDVNLTLNKGEILGLAGLLGSGKTELLKALAGAHRAGWTQFLFRGSPYRPTLRARVAGIALVPEERRREGGWMHDTIVFNIAQGLKAGFLGLIAFADERKAARDFMARLSVRSPDEKKILGELSGGNQQKVIIAKCLARGASVLLLDEPCKGVDLGAQEELFALLRGLADSGVSIIYASAEFDEILRVADRVLVLAHGTTSGELAPDGLSEEDIFHAAAGVAS